MKQFYFILFTLLAFNFGFGQEIASFSNNQNSACSGTTYEDANISTTGICRGPGIVENTGGTYNSRNWTTASSIDTNDYLEWTLTPDAGYQIDLATMDITYDRSGTGPTMLDIQIDTGSGFTSIFTDTSVQDTTGGEDNNGIDLSSFTALTTTITFRLYAFNASGAGGTFDIEENTVTDKGVIINGTITTTSPCASTSIWNGSTWTPSTPDLTTEAIIDADYDTSSYGNIQACSLTVTSDNTLTIDDNTFVEVEHDLTIETDASILVNALGSFVQNDDAGIITNNGSSEVLKTTSLLNNWYEYTYWSSPVVGADIDNGLTESKTDRRFSFSAANYLDATMETNNDNATTPGQDDVDDNGDDWVYENGATVMQPGVGYATMHDPSGFSGPFGGPYSFSYSFEGTFNNGVIPVEVFRNDSELADTNWNFIGNPYPSAIDADEFLAVNDASSTGYMDGAIFLWSQNTEASSTENGNQQLNFSNSDYAIINGSGETAGGDGTTPVVISGHRVIPSGQGFFVGYSNTSPTVSVSGDIATGEVIFNNSMRLTDITANSVFFKGSSSKNTSSSTAIANKLWLDLTSDNGVYNQILIAYVSGATNADDGLTFDANKYPTGGAALYSTIEGSEKKFAIQGKSAESISEDEVIKLGFNSFINVETEYTISINKLQGDFLNTNTVYLKDSLLDITHNLTEADYTFNLDETAEFTDRFTIVFKEDSTLGVDILETNESTLQITELDNDQVNFKTETSQTIESIIIYDIYGRKIYQFEGQSNSETFTLSNVKNAIYIARVQLSNGALITKKAVKQ